MTKQMEAKSILEGGEVAIDTNLQFLKHEGGG